MALGRPGRAGSGPRKEAGGTGLARTWAYRGEQRQGEAGAGAPQRMGGGCAATACPAAGNSRRSVIAACSPGRAGLGAQFHNTARLLRGGHGQGPGVGGGSAGRPVLSKGARAAGVLRTGQRVRGAAEGPSGGPPVVDPVVQLQEPQLCAFSRLGPSSCT